MIDPVERSWNMHALQHLCHAADIPRVLDTPLFHAIDDDCMVWRFDSKGSYSVRSAYRLCMDTFSYSNQWRCASDWRALWSLKVPPKVKVFLWRCCRDCLPTRVRLQRRGVPCRSLCVCCDRDMETCWHALITCPKAQECWRGVQLWHHLEAHLLDCDSFATLFFKMTQLLTSQQLQTLAMTLWSLWTSRNSQLWEGHRESTGEVLCRGVLLLQHGQLLNMFRLNTHMLLYLHMHSFGVNRILGGTSATWTRLSLQNRGALDWVCASWTTMAPSFWPGLYPYTQC